MWDIWVAIGLLIAGNFFASCADVIVKLLGSEGAVFQYLWLRQVFTLLMALPLWMRQSPTLRHPGSFKVHILRAHLSILGATCTVFALLHLSLATANVIFYAAPMVTLFLAWYLLKEQVQKYKLVYALMGFVGVVIALRPDQLHWASVLALVVAFAIAGFNLLVRYLPDTISVASVMFWTNLFALPLTSLLMLYWWIPLTDTVVWMSLGSTITVGLYQICVVKAFRRAPASDIAIAEYSGLIFAALMGWLIFAENLDAYTLTGLLLIVLPMSLQSWQQRRLHKNAVA